MFVAFLAAMTVCVVGVMLSYLLESHGPPTRPSTAAGSRATR